MHPILTQETSRLRREELLRDADAHRLRAAFLPRRRLRTWRRSHRLPR